MQCVVDALFVFLFWLAAISLTILLMSRFPTTQKRFYDMFEHHNDYIDRAVRSEVADILKTSPAGGQLLKEMKNLVKEQDQLLSQMARLRESTAEVKGLYLRKHLHPGRSHHPGERKH